MLGKLLRAPSQLEGLLSSSRMSISSSVMRMDLCTGESWRPIAGIGTAGAAIDILFVRIPLDGCTKDSSDSDRSRLSRDGTLRLIGDKPEGEKAMACDTYRSKCLGGYG